MTKFFNILKKPCFWPIFPNFGTKFYFLENPALSRTTSYGFLASCQNLEKTNDTIPRKCPDRWKDGRKDQQTLFHRTLQVNDRGSKSYTVNPIMFYNKKNTTYSSVGSSWRICCQKPIYLQCSSSKELIVRYT